MAYKSYNRVLFIRLVIAIVNPVLIGWMLAKNNSWFLPGILIVLELILVYELIRFLNKTNEQISFFIQSIKNDDTTLRFPVKTGNAILNELHKSLNELNVILQETKVMSQIKEQYFGEIIQNIGTGVLVLSEQGFVSDVNPATLELLGIQTFTHLKQLDRVDQNFGAQIASLGNKQKKMLTYNKLNEQTQIVVRCSVISLKDQEVRLLTLQDIRGELERKEIDSWIKLIRVMSHEIMNSLAPVTSIAQSLKRIWKDKLQQFQFKDDDDIESTINGLDVIGERGEALKRFVQSYRILTHVPQPLVKSVQIRSFLESLSILLSPFKNEFNVDILFKQPNEEFTASFDEQMIVQVIINLVKNSVESIADQDNGRIEISASKANSGQLKLEIVDNGPGIPSEMIDEVFVPFFTTKTGGTGVGLSHSRQIVRAHAGTMFCSSVPGHTVFTIEL